MKVVLLIVTLAFSVPSAFAINKCLIDGKPVYKSGFCPKGTAVALSGTPANPGGKLQQAMPASKPTQASKKTEQQTGTNNAITPKSARTQLNPRSADQQKEDALARQIKELELKLQQSNSAAQKP